jgi:hypothetical protein
MLLPGTQTESWQPARFASGFKQTSAQACQNLPEPLIITGHVMQCTMKQTKSLNRAHGNHFELSRRQAVSLTVVEQPHIVHHKNMMYNAN